MKAFKKKINKNRVYREYVDILNGKLQLSYREADVFAVLLQLNNEWGSMVKETGNILSTDVRRVLMRETRITKTNLARYTSALKKKEVLLETPSGGLMLNEVFIPDITYDKDLKSNVCEIKFVFELM
jgi:hypothetical protein